MLVKIDENWVNPEHIISVIGYIGKKLESSMKSSVLPIEDLEGTHRAPTSEYWRSVKHVSVNKVKLQMVKGDDIEIEGDLDDVVEIINRCASQG